MGSELAPPWHAEPEPERLTDGCDRISRYIGGCSPARGRCCSATSDRLLIWTTRALHATRVDPFSFLLENDAMSAIGQLPSDREASVSLAAAA